jgi:RNA polymerase sigma-70 factor (ECF subfamily)
VVRKRHPINGVTIEIASGDDGCDDAAKNLGEELRRALSRLRPDYAQAFVLFYEQELCYAEISKIMDCPLGTVKTWIHRARKDIIDQLKHREVFTQTNHS